LQRQFPEGNVAVMGVSNSSRVDTARNLMETKNSEVEKCAAETQKLLAEGRKALAESYKVQRETAWYPLVAGGALFAAAMACGKVFLSLLSLMD
jgi:hypothetical protein